LGADIRDLFRRATESCGRRVLAVGDDQWHHPTPCSAWDVRALVNHVVAENLWVPPLFEGKTIREVGDQFDGDVLGDDPKQVWRDSASHAVGAVEADGAIERTVHLSFGDTPGEEYAYQLFADLLIHGWDVARAIGADDSLDPELVRACAEWFDQREDLYRMTGAIAERVQTDGHDPQTQLLARFGRKR
jgi:uncharacterized protein (TIGR03086 family)